MAAETSTHPQREARPLAKHFDFRSAESRLYDWWQENGWFRPECAPPNAEAFVISIPAPCTSATPSSAPWKT